MIFACIVEMKMNDEKPEPKKPATADPRAKEPRPVPPPPTWQEMIEPERDPRYDPLRWLRH